jgi:hypothetical protein
LLLFGVTPVSNGVADVVMKLARTGLTDIHGGVRFGLTFGAVLVMVMQALAIIVASVIWGLRMRGSGEQS